eukprot:jgi/Orpsp1_1/1175555/evm.model.c7180000054339.1
MKLIFCLVLGLVVQLVNAAKYPYKAGFYGCPNDCETGKRPKCSKGIPSDRMFAAIPEQYFDKYGKKFCSDNYVGMAIDPRANSNYKMVRAKIIDQCGSCDDHQIELSQQAFEKMANIDYGIISMVYVFVHNGKIVEGPIYSNSDFSSFAKRQGVSKDLILESFEKAAIKLANGTDIGLKKYPWLYDEYRTEKRN